MHRWDRHLQPPREARPPVRWSEAMSRDEQRELQSSRWRRSSHGYYVPAFIEVTAAQRVREAHNLLPQAGAIGGWAAAHWHGAPFFEGTLPDGTLMPVLICLGSDGARRQRGRNIEVSRDRLPQEDVVTVNGLRCTTPLRTAFDLARRARGQTSAVAAIDTLLECGLIRQPEYAAYVARHRGWAGIARARESATLCRLGVRSPMETGVRLLWEVTAAYPPLLVNQPVFSLDGLLLGIPDLLDKTSATVIEYDGADHQDPNQVVSDRRRDSLFHEHGLIVVRVTDDDMRGSRDELIERFGRARLRGLQRDPRHDRWTLERPDGWRPPW
jgi:hypothetical protein